MASDDNVEKEKSGILGYLRDEKIRAGILASVIASIFVIIFVQPILNGVWAVIVVISSQIYSGYVDSVYKNASLGQRNYLDFVILLLFESLFAASIICLFVFLGKAMGREERKFLELIGEASPREEKDIENLKEEIKGKFKSGKRLKMAAWVILPISFLPFFLFLTAVFVELQINTSFRQRVAVLAPHISQYQEESLFAQWALMHTRNDYLKITSGMDQMAEEFKIKLPKPLID